MDLRLGTRTGRTGRHLRNVKDIKTLWAHRLDLGDPSMAAVGMPMRDDLSGTGQFVPLIVLQIRVGQPGGVRNKRGSSGRQLSYIGLSRRTVCTGEAKTNHTRSAERCPQVRPQTDLRNRAKPGAISV